jgi:predicted component of viral defense system (DUF524 family)
MEDQIKLLNQQLLQKDETINVMKVRTKEFVHNMKEEHSSTLRNLEAALAKASEVSLHDLYSIILSN